MWFPRGLALEHFSDKIRPEVERILANIDLPEVEKLIVKLYMIGRNEQKANPIIMICCCDKATRKKAEASIRESGLLDQEGNCGFGLGSTGLPLETSFLPYPLGEDIYSDTHPSAEEALKVDIYGLTGPGIGRKFGFVVSSQSGRTVQYATGGPILGLGGHTYQLTVAHAMNHSSTSNTAQEQDWDTDKCEFDGQSDEDDDESLILSRGSISPAESVKDKEPDSDQQDSQQSPSSSESYTEIPDTPLAGGQNLRASLISPESLQTEHGEVEWDPSCLLCSYSMPCGIVGEPDYLMIKLPTEASDLAQEPNRVTIDGPSECRHIQVDDIASVKADVTKILAITSRGPIFGDIVADSVSFKTGVSNSFQQLLTVLLSRGLREGDSGSAVVDAQTGHFYGHVVLGVDGDCVAYVLPSKNIMAKIITQYLQLLSSHRADKNMGLVFHRTANRTAVDSLLNLINSAGPSFSDQEIQPNRVAVPADNLLTLQRELKDAWAAADMLNTELRDNSSPAQSASNSDFADSKDFYGYLYEANKNPTKVLHALLHAIALYIAHNIGDKRDQTLSPTKLAAFYKAVGGDYDRLFLNVSSESISFIWQVFGCLYVHQSTNNQYEAPTTPSLTVTGFVRWQSLQILLGPEEHVPYIIFAVKNWDLKDPDTGESFPKDIPATAFPNAPDSEITAWYAAGGEKLRKEETPQDSPGPDSPRSDCSSFTFDRKPFSAVNYSSSDEEYYMSSGERGMSMSGDNISHAYNLYPTEDETQELMRQTGLPKTRIY